MGLESGDSYYENRPENQFDTKKVVLDGEGEIMGDSIEGVATGDWNNGNWYCFQFSVAQGNLENLKKNSPSFEISANFERTSDDKGFPVEIYGFGGVFAIRETGSYYFYETENFFSQDRLPEGVFKEGKNNIKLVQKGNILNGYLNGQLIGTYTLKDPNMANFRDGNINLFFKGKFDKENPSRVTFSNIKFFEIH